MQYIVMIKMNYCFILVTIIILNSLINLLSLKTLLIRCFYFILMREAYQEILKNYLILFLSSNRTLRNQD